MVTSNF